MGTAIVSAVDEHATHTHLAHFAERDFLGSRCEHYSDSALFVLGLEARLAFELAQQRGYRIIPPTKDDLPSPFRIACLAAGGYSGSGEPEQRASDFPAAASIVSSRWFLVPPRFHRDDGGVQSRVGDHMTMAALPSPSRRALYAVRQTA
jgi:hypothetical protein